MLDSSAASEKKTEYKQTHSQNSVPYSIFNIWMKSHFFYKNKMILPAPRWANYNSLSSLIVPTVSQQLVPTVSQQLVPAPRATPAQCPTHRWANYNSLWFSLIPTISQQLVPAPRATPAQCPTHRWRSWKAIAGGGSAAPVCVRVCACVCVCVWVCVCAPCLPSLLQYIYVILYIYI